MCYRAYACYEQLQPLSSINGVDAKGVGGAQISEQAPREWPGLSDQEMPAAQPAAARRHVLRQLGEPLRDRELPQPAKPVTAEKLDRALRVGLEKLVISEVTSHQPGARN